MKRCAIQIVTFIFFSVSASAQLTGTKNIPGDYTTLALAITDLNTQGVGPGGVALNLVAGNPQTAPVGGYSVTAQGNATDQITISGNSNTITTNSGLVAGTLTDAVFKIIGGDYITITGFVMQENALNVTMTPVGSNDMTEWGVALLYGSTTNGAQHNTIQGNSISLNRSYQYSWGVYSSTRHSATAPTVTANITNATGANSNNRVWGNTISNVNMGVAFIGSGTASSQDDNNDVGGSSLATGNTFTNWCGATYVSSFISNSQTNYCVFMFNQRGYNVSYNSITSAVTPPSGSMLRGIAQEYSPVPTGTFTNTISYNTITLTCNMPGMMNGIQTMSGVNTMTLNIVYNRVMNCTITGVGSGCALNCITNNGPANTVNINYNVIENNSSTATIAGFLGIQSIGVAVSAVNINNNQIGTTSGNAITFSDSTTGAVQGIVNQSGSSGSTLSILNNDLRGLVHTVRASSVHTYISNSAPAPHTNISNNTFTNLVANTTGNVTFIGQVVTHNPSTTHNVNNNSVVGSYAKTAVGGTVYFYNTQGLSPTTVTEINTGNNFSNMSFTGATVVFGWRVADGAASYPFGSSRTITNNTFTNITGGTSNVIVMYITYASGYSTTNNVSGNVIYNVSGGGALIGIQNGPGPLNIFDNTIHGLSSGGNLATNGMAIFGGEIVNISNNRIYDVENTNSAGSVIGINGAAATLTVFNNLIADLRAPVANSGNAVVGISAGEYVFNNTIYLNCTSTGTNFGSSGIYSNTGGDFDMRNNLVVNLSVPNGTGVTVAYRRSTTSLQFYNSTSNNNSLYAGTPSANHLIFYDGTNSMQTIAAFRAYVAPRESNSVSENPTFSSISGASPVFLHIPLATVTVLESGGTNSAGITTDCDYDARPGPVGSVNGGGIAPDIGADEFDGIMICNGTPTSGTATVSSAVCASGTFTLNLTGESTGIGITYQWQESTINGGPYNNIPGATSSSYTTGVISTTMYYVAVVTCTGSGISSTTAQVIAIVNPLPSVVANVTATSICIGSSVTFTGSGATSYVWSGGVSNNVPFAPASTDTYTVTGTDANSCQNSASVTVTVNSLPIVVAGVSDDTVCAGSSVTFTGGGASTYTWTGGVTNNVPFTISANGTFTVTGTDANGCQDSDVISLVANSLPSVTLNLPLDTICQNAGSVTLTGESPSGGTWSGPGISGNSFDPNVSGIGMIGINYLYTDGNGCSNSATDSIWVDLCNDVNMLSESTGVLIYPNPNDGYFTIRLLTPSSTPVHVAVLNGLGQVITEFDFSTVTHEVDLNDAESGVYFIHTTNGQTVSVLRVIKQ